MLTNAPMNDILKVVMALFLKQPDKRSELQTRIAGELRDKLNARDVQMEDVEPAATDNQTTTKGVGIIIALIVVMVIVGFAIWLATSS